MKKVAVFFGGPGSEYEVSLHSTVSVLQYAPNSYQFLLVGVTKEGLWLLGDYSIEEIEQDTWQLNQTAQQVIPSFSGKKCLIQIGNQKEIAIDCVLNMIHGSYGEDGSLSALLQIAAIPTIGSGLESSSICFDKEIVHRLFCNTVVEMANYQVIYQNQKHSIETILEKTSFPFIVKPAREGSSYGVHLVKNKEEYQSAIEDAFHYDSKVVIEEYVKGVELGCAVLETEEKLITGEIDQISLSRPVFDYEAKYEMVDAEILCPAPIEEGIKEKVKQQALYIFKQLECKDLARIDFFLTEDGRILLNEINTIPGFTNHSRFPNMFAKSGISFPHLIELLIEGS